MSNGLQPPDTPPVLYKYREFGNDYHWKTIADGEFYCAHADSFNDPFDLNPVMSSISDEVVIERASVIIAKTRGLSWGKLPPSAKAMIGDKARDLLVGGSNTVGDAKQVILDGLKEGPIKLFGVLSLSGCAKQPLMWAHYAKSHTGFCVGIDTSELHDVQRQVFDLPDHPLLELIKVDYGPDRQPISSRDALRPETQKGRDEWKKAISHKYEGWDYEEEWRLVSYKNPGYSVKMGCEAISEIILGCRISEENKEKVFDLVCTEYTSPPDLFQAELDDQEYRLNIEPISLP